MAGQYKDWVVVQAESGPTPFQGGYQDFIPFTTLQEATQNTGPSRQSIFDDLCYYVENYHHLMRLSEDPKSAYLFLYKILASESVLLVQYFNGVLNFLGWQLSRRNELRVFPTDWIEQRWSDLIAIQRRIGGYIDSVKLSISSLEPSNGSPASSSWMNCEEDFRWLEARLEKLQDDARSLIEAFSGLAAIVGNQQTLSEARSVSYLNVLVTTFVPLSLVASILSLPTPYKPGASDFWKYWAIGVPLVAGIFAVSFALTLGLRGSRKPSATHFTSNIHQSAKGRKSTGRPPIPHTMNKSSSSKSMA